MNVRKHSFPLYIHIVTIFLVVAIALSGLIIYRSYMKGTELAIQASNQLFDQLRGKVTERINRMYDPVISMVHLAVTLNDISAPISNNRSHPLFDFLATALDKHPSLYALYLGFENGDFFEVARINDKPEMKKMLDVPKNTHYGVMTITQDASGVPSQVWSFLDRNRMPLGKKRLPTVDYDPRTRPWYRLSTQKKIIVRTKPYVFAKLGQPGITFAHHFKGAHSGVFGVDISLATLSKFLAEQQFTPSSTVLFFDSTGTVTGYPNMDRIIKKVRNLNTGAVIPTFATIEELDRPELTFLFHAFKKEKNSNAMTFSVADRLYIGVMAQMPIILDKDNFLGIVAPLDEFLGPIYHIGRENVFSSAFILLLTTPIIWWASRRISRPLKELTEEIVKVQRMNLDTVGEVSTHIAEIRQLSRSFKKMTLALKDYERRLVYTQGQLRLLVEIGIALAKERHFDKLLETILLNGKQLSYADGGTLYLKGEDERLHFKILRNDTLGLALGGEKGAPITLAPLPFVRDSDGHPHKFHVATFVAQTGQTIRIDNAYDSDKSDFPGLREVDKKIGYLTVSLLTVPIKTQRGEVLGVMQLVNARDPITKDVIPFNEDTVGFIKALTSQAAIAMENQHLIETQKQLFNAFIQMIATAIDTKSPYTGGHCARVPVLATLLSEAASSSTEEAFAKFKMNDEDRYALHLAAWLHDCGKIATPEYIVDKATKLETIYNRIHEVRTRFEILRRDAEIHYLKSLAKENADAPSLMRRFEAEVAILEEEFAFIAACNIGSEFLNDSKKERIKNIAARTWTRHFDDRLGLSHGELNRFCGIPSEKRPVQVSLLADMAEHQIPRRPLPGLARDSKLDFRVKVPELFQNMGEIHNLCIERGTLTEEDRYQITEHIILTIRMLEKLPFPKALCCVPEYVGAHHETMIGTGYPRKLIRDQISIPARIMAIADIFEALTASDRPYKKAKTLSEAIRIMHFMARDQHIDADLFQLFLEKELYLSYAKDHLTPEQIDNVDKTAFT